MGETSLECEGNRYNDISKNGIGWHGDAERKKVIALRLGESMPICFYWFKQSKPIGSKFTITGKKTLTLKDNQKHIMYTGKII